MGQNWAISIGINTYQNLRSLRFAQSDAEGFKSFTIDDLNGHPNQVYYFSENSPPIPQDYGPAIESRPTYTALKRFLRVRFEKRFLGAADTLWFFFAGHGMRYRGRDYLIPADGDPEDIEDTAFSVNSVTQRLRLSGAGNIVLLLDACRSEEEGSRDGRGVGRDIQQGVVTFYSCSPEKSSFEIDELQQGAFTYALLEGLRAQGEANCATVERLERHVKQRVPDLNRQHGKPKGQEPYARWEPGSRGKMVLVPQLATPKDAEKLMLEAYRANSQRNYLLAKQLCLQVLAVSPVDPDAIGLIEELAQVSQPQPESIPEEPPIPPEPAQETGLNPELVDVKPQPKKSSFSREPNIESTKPKTDKAPDLSESTFKFDVVTITGVEQRGGILGIGGKPEVLTKRQSKEGRRYIELLENGIQLEMVFVPGGTFKMGSPKDEGADSERPQHSVTVDSFWMGRYTITQAQYFAIVGKNPSKFTDSDQLPVERVNWNEAKAFCQRLSQTVDRTYRLPSEAEWEYACRARTNMPFHFGKTITAALANFNGNYTYGAGPKGEYRQNTTPVGSFGVANGFGLYDMHGNVWEWCEDVWHDSYAGAPPGGTPWIEGGDSSRRVLRGGSWFNLPRNCRSAIRFWFEPDGRLNDIGFRVVCSSA